MCANRTNNESLVTELRGYADDVRHSTNTPYVSGATVTRAADTIESLQDNCHWLSLQKQELELQVQDLQAEVEKSRAENEQLKGECVCVVSGGLALCPVHPIHGIGGNP